MKVSPLATVIPRTKHWSHYLLVKAIEINSKLSLFDLDAIGNLHPSNQAMDDSMLFDMNRQVLFFLIMSIVHIVHKSVVLPFVPYLLNNSNC